jgi:hypothetical protein
MFRGKTGKFFGDGLAGWMGHIFSLFDFQWLLSLQVKMKQTIYNKFDY